MKKLTFTNSFVIRTPLFPLNDIANYETQWKSLSKAFEDSLFLASPNLLNKIKKAGNKQGHNPAELDKLKLSFYKYWTRAHMRCTPYGLFAGCYVGNWGENNHLLVPDTEAIKRNTNLDMNFLCMLSQHLESHPDIVNQLQFSPNTSIYYSGQKIRYIYYTYDEQNNRSHQLNSVEVNKYVERILSKAKTGALPMELALILVDEEISIADASHFVNQFIQAQLLVSEFEVAITGPEYLDQILTILNSLKTPTSFIEKTSRTLSLLKNKLKALDQQKFNAEENYQEIIEVIKTLELPFDISKLFQTNSYKIPTESASLSKKIQKELIYAIDFLQQLIPSTEASDLDLFVKKFYEKYEGKKVKLLDVLDMESGLGFPLSHKRTSNNPIVNGIPEEASEQIENDFKWRVYEKILHELLERSQQNNEFEIDLKPEREKLKFNTLSKDFPATISLKGEAVGLNESGDLQFKLDIAGGSSGINPLGRFAHDSKEIFGIIKSAIEFEKEKHTDALLTEIVHLPQNRTGNVLKHPQFLDYEIAYLSKSSVTKSHSIQLADLELFMRGNRRLVLWSKKYQKEVIPRLSNAHNFPNSALPIYHFLCALQYHRTTGGVTFSWSSWANISSFLPRIRFGNIILSEAKWLIKEKALDVLLKRVQLREQGIEQYFKDFCSAHKLPKRFVIADGDNKILIDSQSSISIKMFVDLIKNREYINISEFLFDQFKSVSQDKMGNPYTNEVIATLYNTASVIDPIKNAPPPYSIPATFPPGSSWIYYKIYCGSKTSDLILTDYIKPFIDQLRKTDVFEKWFFIRYNDPENHLRFRIKLRQMENLGTVQQSFYSNLQKLLDQGIINNLQLDTYKREISRYGVQTMDLSEEYFCIDSENIAHFLSRIEGEEGEEYRWQFALASIDSLLNSFEYNLSQKGRLLKKIATDFATEFGIGKYEKKQIDKKFRANKDTIHTLIQKNKKEEEYEEFYAIIKSKEERLKGICDAILNVHQNGQIQPGLDQLLTSYIHMLCNRLFNSNQRFHEMVIYQLLAKYYASEIGRTKFHQ